MKKAFLILLLPLFFIAPQAQAANLPILNPEFTIVPAQCHACPCGYAGTLQLIQNLVNASISLAFLILIIVITYAGALFLMSPANPGNREMGKTVLTNAIIGIVIVMAAWLFVDFIMKSLYDPGAEIEGAKLGPWNEIIGGNGEWCVVGKPTKPLFGGGDFGDSGLETTPGAETPGAGVTVDEAGKRATLAAAGVSVSREACTATKTSNCTNVGGLQTATIQQAVEIKADCGCTLVVTGGSEPGHAAGTYSHAKGYKVDFRRNAEIDAFFQSFTSTGKRSDGAATYKDKCGNSYANEGDHWDVTVLSVCSVMK